MSCESNDYRKLVFAQSNDGLALVQLNSRVLGKRLTDETIFQTQFVKMLVLVIFMVYTQYA